MKGTNNFTSVIFTGLPGSGKTTCGALLGEKCGLPFFDTDELIESSECKTIKDIFATEGEEHFRLLEREVLRLLEEELARRRSPDNLTNLSDSDGRNPVSVELAARVASEMQAASESRGMVIAVGGGVPEPESNRLALKRLGTVVYLAADPFEIASRLSDDGLRPLLSTNSAEAKGAERSGNHPGSERSNMVSKLNGLLDRRRQAYECADIKIDTTGLSPHQIINVLQERLKTHLKI